MTRIAIIGFGEAGGIFAEELAAAHQVSVWDKKFLTDMQPELAQRAAAMEVRAATSLADAVADAELIFSLVTAASALEVVQEAAPLLNDGQYFLDLNSVAPDTKRQGAQRVASHGGHYIDVAVMAPVPPKRLATPLLLGGAQAAKVATRLQAMQFDASALSEQVGDVSAIKMCRSVMIKGLEALTSECLRAARRYGVEQQVLHSLHASFPSLGWQQALPHYLISRVAEHGKRRAEEMHEVVRTLQDVGLDGAMSQATAHTQARLVEQMQQQGLNYQDLLPFDWTAAADRLR